jgi:hypothetical protein
MKRARFTLLVAAVLLVSFEAHAAFDMVETPIGVSPGRMRTFVSDHSPDGRHFIEVVGGEEKCLIVLDGQTVGDYEKVRNAEIKLSPDGRRWLARLQTTTGKTLVVLDGILQKNCPDAKPTLAAFSADGNHLAYPAYSDSGWAVVRDGKRGAKFPDLILPVDELVMSPDGKHVAYDIDDYERGAQVVLDGKKGRTYDNVYSLVLSPDGKRLVYVAQRPDPKALVVIDTDEHAAGFQVLEGPFFSPDGKHVAYSYEAEGAQRVALDGIAGPGYQKVKGLAFSGDGSKLGYLASSQDTWKVIVGGEVRIKFTDGSVPGCLALDPTGASVAYSLENGGRWAVFQNGQPGPVQYHEVSNLQFCPDGSRTAYVVGDDEVAYVMVDTMEGRAFPEVLRETFRFSPDYRHYAYFARKSEDEAENLCVVLDNEATAGYRALVKGGPTFAADGAVEFLGSRENKLYRVRLVPKADE